MNDFEWTRPVSPDTISRLEFICSVSRLVSRQWQNISTVYPLIPAFQITSSSNSNYMKNGV